MPLESDQHDHCQACHDGRCDSRLASCDIVQCELECGARFHACKQSEHALLCGNEKVPCINAGYGCPIEVQRSQMSRHLGRCPASLVHCTMEWNRWPVCSSERQSHQPVQVLMDFNKEQLDIALALRDQRMLTKSMRASIRTRQILTNNLNRRHPAVPLASQLTNGSSEKDFNERKELDNLLQDMHQWENETEKKRSRSPAGLRQSICDELYRASENTAQQLSNALNVIAGNNAPPDRPDFRLGSGVYPYIHCAHCERRKERLDRLIDSHKAMQDSSEDSQPVKAIDGEDGDKPIINLNGEASHHHDNDDANPRDITKAVEEDSVTEEHLLKPTDNATPSNKDVQGPPSIVDVQGHRGSSSSEGSLDEVPMPALFVTPSTTGQVSAAPGRGQSKILVIEPPKMIPGSRVTATSDSPFQASLSLDLSLESITRYQAKPDSMYTFLCAQVFRRDEFASHFQNVHSDIHGGLNGWLEQRCPLAPYGCTYSQRRFYPGEKSARVVHNEHLESFGVRLDGNNTPIRSGDCSRVDAPMEMEWVHVGVSQDSRGEETVKRVDGNSKKGHVEKTDFEDVKKNHSEIEKSDCESDKTDRGAEFIIKNEPDQSDVSLHAVHQSGRSCHPNQDDVQLNLENANQSEGPQPETQRVLINSSTASFERGSVQSDSANPKTGQSQPDYLSQLPSELLRYLTRFLDAFSLCNLALTSKLLRQICCSILEDRGMVIQHWEKQQGRWDVAYRVWHFSTAFTPIRNWGFEEQPSLSVHLSKCPYNVTRQRSDPVRVMIKLPESMTSSGEDTQDGKGAETEAQVELAEEGDQ